MAAYRNGTYVAFNGMGTTDPTKSDMKYYGLLQLWDKSNHHDLTFSDSHHKTYSVQDSSHIDTLKARLLLRLKDSKHLFLITTENASINRGLLNWEIEKAVETYEIPIIVAYPGYEKISHPFLLKDRWPDKLKYYIEKNLVKTIHIPFRQAIINNAIDNYSVHSPPLHTVTKYSDEFYAKHGIQ